MPLWLGITGLLACGIWDPNEQEETTDTGPSDDERTPPGDDYVPSETDAVDTDVGSVYDTTIPWNDASVRVRLEGPNRPWPEGEASGQFQGQIVSTQYALDELDITFRSTLAGDLDLPSVDGDGRFTFTTEELAPGTHDITLTATAPNEDVGGAKLTFGVCVWPELTSYDFTSNPLGTGWTAYGDAYWDNRGWIDVTGNYQSRAGSIYRTDRRIDPGNFKIDFDFATGRGMNSGADGYAVNIVDVLEVKDLERYIEAAQHGGCLGYGSAGACGSYPVNAFHVELDTWYNGEYADPTQGNHMAVALDGKVEDVLLWAPIQLEDSSLTWKKAEVFAIGSYLSVKVDGVEIMGEDISGFQFDGGYIGVSGSTGWASNEHRFDDLVTYEPCTVP